KGNPVGTLDGKLKDQGEQRLSLCLVGKVMATKLVNREAFMDVMQTFWRFRNVEDRKRIQTGGPWSFDRAVIIFEEPIGTGEISLMQINSIEFWIQIHNLPLICMTEDIVIFLGKMIGEVRDIDMGSANNGSGRYVRVRVLIDAKEPLNESAKAFPAHEGQYEQKNMEIVKGYFGSKKPNGESMEEWGGNDNKIQSQSDVGTCSGIDCAAEIGSSSWKGEYGADTCGTSSEQYTENPGKQILWTTEVIHAQVSPVAGLSHSPGLGPTKSLEGAAVAGPFDVKGGERDKLKNGLEVGLNCSLGGETGKKHKPLKWKRVAPGMGMGKNLGENLGLGKMDKSERQLCDRLKKKNSKQNGNGEEGSHCDGGSGMVASWIHVSMEDKGRSGQINTVTTIAMNTCLIRSCRR
ncbi:hypothetical protein Ddye_023016, partial [Dipteronia dyeriana]